MAELKDELRPCPFCGMDARICKQYKSSNPGNFEDMHYQIKCTYCSAQSGWADDVQFIVDWWNGEYNNALQSEPSTLKQSVKDADGELFTDWECLHDSPLLADNLKAEGIKLARTCLRSHGLIGKE